MKAIARKLVYRLRKIPPELFLWAGALLALAFLDPRESGHVSLCLFKNLGIDHCPGCGLGHAVAYFYRGELAASFQAHPLGIPAVGIILNRCYQLIVQSRVTHPNTGGRNGKYSGTVAGPAGR